ncbi:MAG: hypothetical protein ABFE01_17245 [Phycisphaerales bacterium]
MDADQVVGLPADVRREVGRGALDEGLPRVSHIGVEQVRTDVQDRGPGLGKLLVEIVAQTAGPAADVQH